MKLNILLTRLRLQTLKFLAFALILASNSANAGYLASRHVVDIGCEGINCYVTFDGAAVDGPPGTTCAANTTEFRWDGSTPMGRVMYASFLSAFTTNKLVSVLYLLCYVNGYGGTYITPQYYHVTN